ncbi:hypothetical protein [Muricoccus radiodurans]|uniref:hypothetical protein n=1 Tax=Muricoccus radiodurans TaxID=2231721 RepID=UPI003CEA9266
MPRLLLALVLALLALPARAGDPADCLGRPEAAPCTDRALREADRRLRATWREATATTVRPATLAAGDFLWRARLREGQTDLGDGPARPYDTAQLLEMVRYRTEELRELLRQDRATRPARFGRSCPAATAGAACPMPRNSILPELGRACLGTALRNCRVREAGTLVSEDGGLLLLWQVQDGHTDRDGVRTGAVILEPSPDRWRPLAWAFEGEYRAPRLIERDGARLLVVPGRRIGSGGHDADLLLVQRDGRWREVEIATWRRELERRLPDGLGAWQGVDYDFSAMTARTRLWRPDDGNCCPTGGSALATLRIEGDSLRLADLTAEPAPR